MTRSSPLAIFVFLLTFMASNPSFAQICPDGFIMEHFNEQRKVISGDRSNFQRFISGLKNRGLITKPNEEKDTYFCNNVLINLSVSTNLANQLPPEVATPSDKINSLRVLSSLYLNYRAIRIGYIDRGAIDDAMVGNLDEILMQINNIAKEIIEGHSTAEILGFDPSHGDAPVYRLIYRSNEETLLYEASFANGELLETTRALSEFSQTNDVANHDAILLTISSLTGRWSEWAAMNEMEARFGRSEDIIFFGSGGHALPLRWATDTNFHTSRRAALDEFRTAIFHFLIPAPYRADETIPLPANRQLPNTIVDETLQTGDCIRYLSNDNNLYVYAGPDTSSGRALLARSVSTSPFSLISPIIDSPEHAETSMTVNAGRVILFEDQEALTWAHARDVDGYPGYLVYSYSMVGAENDLVQFEKVNCND